MKSFVVKPFIVEPLAGRLPPHWHLFLVAWVALFFGLGLLAMGLAGRSSGVEATLICVWLSILAILSGGAFITIARFVKDSQSIKNELRKRMTEQDERIHKLEAQIAALTSLNSQR